MQAKMKLDPDNTSFCLQGILNDVSTAKFISADPKKIMAYAALHASESVVVVRGALFEIPHLYRWQYQYWKEHAGRRGMGYAVIASGCNKNYCGLDNEILDIDINWPRISCREILSKPLPMRRSGPPTLLQNNSLLFLLQERNMLLDRIADLDLFLKGYWEYGWIASKDPKALTEDEAEIVIRFMSKETITDFDSNLRIQGFIPIKDKDWREFVSEDELEAIRRKSIARGDAIQEAKSFIEKLKLSENVFYSDIYIGKVADATDTPLPSKRYPVVGKLCGQNALIVIGPKSWRYQKLGEEFKKLGDKEAAIFSAFVSDFAGMQIRRLEGILPVGADTLKLQELKSKMTLTAKDFELCKRNMVLKIAAKMGCQAAPDFKHLKSGQLAISRPVDLPPPTTMTENQAREAIVSIERQIILKFQTIFPVLPKEMPREEVLAIAKVRERILDEEEIYRQHEIKRREAMPWRKRLVLLEADMPGLQFKDLSNAISD